ncbi:hypothetical protein LCGC14_1839160 [marine sediment metagenome]|uniref:RNA polymerase sigma-70 domain-containing protein n=1 Tax=marine sediment metagenome TaxID=412755 RepID=A0A0F9IT56_9ZZZZ
MAAKANLGWYLERITDTELLTAEQEKQLARRIREHHDPVAREQMIQANLRLVVNIAKQFAHRGMPLSDLVAEGNLGLVRAVEEFDPDAGARFSTYGAWWIKQAIKRAMINGVQPVAIPAYMAQQVTKWRRATRELEDKLGRTPTVEEIAKKLKAAGLATKAAATRSSALSPSQRAADTKRRNETKLAKLTFDRCLEDATTRIQSAGVEVFAELAELACGGQAGTLAAKRRGLKNREALEKELRARNSTGEVGWLAGLVFELVIHDNSWGTMGPRVRRVLEAVGVNVKSVQAEAKAELKAKAATKKTTAKKRAAATAKKKAARKASKPKASKPKKPSKKTTKVNTRKRNPRKSAKK